MTIPPAHRKWLIVFGVSVVVWVGLAVATVAGKSSLEVRAFRSIFSVTLSGGAFYISSFEDKKLDPGFYASSEPEKHLIEPPPFHMALFQSPNFFFDTPPNHKWVCYIVLPFWVLPLSVLITWAAWTWRAKRLHPLQPGAMRSDGTAGLKKRFPGNKENTNAPLRDA